MSVLLARLATFLTFGWMFSAALVVGFIVVGAQEWVASGQASVAPVIVMLLPLAIFSVAMRRRWSQVREDEYAQRELAAGMVAECPRNLHVVDVSPLVSTIRMTAWTLPFWVLWLAVVPLSVGGKPSPLIVLTIVAVGVVLLGVVLLGRAVPPSIAGRIALIAPLAVVPVIGVEASSAWTAGKLWSDMAGAFASLLLAAIAMVVALRLAAALYSLERSPHVQLLKRIERKWMTHRRAPALITRIRKAPLAFVTFHVAGALLGFLAFIVITVAVPSLLGIGFGVGLAIYLAWRRSARKRVRPTEREAVARDTRRPILLLRSFADDEIELSTVGTEQSIAEWAARQFNRIGPVVALARPGGRAAGVGPYPVELLSEDWQNAVANRIAGSRFVVVLFGVTQGLMWELQQIVAQHAENRALIVFPPIRPVAVARRWQQLDAAVKRMPSLRGIAHLDPTRIRFAHVGEGGELTAVTCAFKSRTAYEVALGALMTFVDPEDGSSNHDG